MSKETKETKEKPIVDETKESLKIKKKPTLKNKESKITKVDLKPKQEDAVQEPVAEKIVLQPDEKKEEQKLELQEVGEPHVEESTTQKSEEKVTPIIEVVNEEETKIVEKQYKEAIRDEKVLGKKLPENIEKLVSFMEETGGTVEDYVSLNKDYSKYDEKALLSEYYKKTKPHLNKEEINFLMEDNFSYDEDVDEERPVRKRQKLWIFSIDITKNKK